MKIITINIPDQYLDCIETLVNMGYYPSRSEAFRQAIRRFLCREQNLRKNLNPGEFKTLQEIKMNTMLRTH